MILEGDRLVRDALARGLSPEAILVSERRTDLARELAQDGRIVRVLSDSLFGSVSQLATSPGVLALVPIPEPRGLDQLPASSDALIVVVAGIQDPRNLGALARSADVLHANT